MTISVEYILIAIGIAWGIQAFLSYIQVQNFYHKLSQLRKIGTCGIGSSGNIYKTKVYAILVINKQKKIIDAEKFSGITVFARPRTIKSLIGLSINDLNSKSVKDVSPKVLEAFRNAAQTILNKENGE